MYTKALKLFALASMMSLAACSEKNIETVPAKLLLIGADEMGTLELVLSDEAGSADFSFTAENEWYIRVPDDADWLTVNPLSGEGAGENPITVTVTVQANENSSDRSATLAFVCDNLEQKALLQVTQLRQYYLNVIADRDIISKDGGDATFTISTNGTWEYELDSEGQTWLTEKSATTNTLVLTASALSSGLENNAVVTFSVAEKTGLTQSFTLSQSNIEILIDALEIYAAYDAESIDLDVVASGIAEWSVSENPTWTTTEKLSDSQLRVTFTTNSDTSNREGNLTITGTTDDNSTLTYTLKLIQYPAPPVVDMVDVVFAADGSATDVSTTGREITYVSGTNCTISFNETYQRYAPTFNHTFNSGVSSGFYKFNVDSVLESALDDGYTLEAVVMIGMEPTGVEIKAFSATKSGGTALMVGSSSYGNELLFLINENGTWRFVRTGVTPEVGTFYHIVGVWDKANSTAYVYLDGELKNTMTVSDNLRHGQNDPNYFTVGGNQNTQDQINGPWNGSVVVARIYDAPLTSEEVAQSKIYIDMAGEKFIIVK